MKYTGNCLWRTITELLDLYRYVTNINVILSPGLTYVTRQYQQLSSKSFA